MYRKNFISIIFPAVVALLSLSCSSRIEDGWVSLFNGKDLTGWEPHGCGKFYVDDEHNLVTENGPENEYGYLVTDRNYDDFDLKLEFLQVGDGNSGVFFHSSAVGYNFVNGWQCEVAPKGLSTGGIYESFDVPVDGDKGRRWLAKVTDEQQEYLKPGEWNSLRLRVQAGNVQTWLNGGLITDIKDDALIAGGTGRIMLQIHSGDNVILKWRNIKLLPLGKFEDDPIPAVPTKRVYLFNGKDLSDWDVCVNPLRLEGDANDAFKAEDGVVKVSGICLGGITTKTAWRDYRLHLEFRYTGEGFAERKGKAADGGILFHCVGPEGCGWKDTWHISFEANIIQGACGDMIMVGHNPEFKACSSSKVIRDSLKCWNPESGQVVSLRGRGRANSPLTFTPDYRDAEDQPVTGPEHPYGEWNEMEVVCDADRAEYYLNGVKLMEFFDLSPSSGRIQLQSEHHGIEYRNIYIEPVKGI